MGNSIIESSENFSYLDFWDMARQTWVDMAKKNTANFSLSWELLFYIHISFLNAMTFFLENLQTRVMCTMCTMCRCLRSHWNYSSSHLRCLIHWNKSFFFHCLKKSNLECGALTFSQHFRRVVCEERYKLGEKNWDCLFVLFTCCKPFSFS